MSTVQDLIDSIKDDLQRTDIDSRILAGINAAHNHYQDEMTWFNEATATVTTSIGQAAYGTADGVPQYMGKLRLITLQQNTNNVYKLEFMSFKEFKTINTNPTGTTGLPGQYTLYNNQILLYTTPDGAYPMSIFYNIAYGTLTVGQSTVWTDNAQDLIEARATYWVATRVTLEPDRASTAKMLEVEALQSIRQRTYNLVTEVLMTQHSPWW